MLKKPIWSAIETTLFYYSGDSTTGQVRSTHWLEYLRLISLPQSKYTVTFMSIFRFKRVAKIPTTKSFLLHLVNYYALMLSATYRDCYYRKVARSNNTLLVSHSEHLRDKPFLLTIVSYLKK